MSSRADISVASRLGIRMLGRETYVDKAARDVESGAVEGKQRVRYKLSGLNDNWVHGVSCAHT